MNLLQAESGLSLVQEREDRPVQTNPIASPPDALDVPDANIIIRSSDLVNFRVHKSVLSMTSPVFKGQFAVPQPSDGETVDGLPVVQLCEDSDLLNILVSMLYHLRPLIPKSYVKVLYSLAIFSPVVPNVCYKVLHLLAACQKYEMATVQSSIRDKVSQGEFPAPKGAEAFSAYMIASSKGLIPEMESAARQTLDHPMTFEIIGEGLRLSEGRALQDLANFRKRYRDNLASCFESFLNIEGLQFKIEESQLNFQEPQFFIQEPLLSIQEPPLNVQEPPLNIQESQFNIWTSCAYYTHIPAFGYSASSSYSRSALPMSDTNRCLPAWLAGLYKKHLGESREAFSKSLFNSRNIRAEYLSGVQAHIKSDSCVSCTKVHTEKGETFCKGLEDRLTGALNEVCHCSNLWRSCESLKMHLPRRSRI